MSRPLHSYLAGSLTVVSSLKVSHANGVSEKLLGDFIRKHDCRDRIFRMYANNPEAFSNSI